jgi:hypothetical protein
VEKTDKLLPSDIRTADSIVKSVLIVLPLSRKWAVEMQAKQLARMNRFTDINVELLVFIDNNDIKPQMVADMFERYEMPIAYRIAESGRHEPHEVRLFYRRDRMVEMLTMVQGEILKIKRPFDMMFMVEDDTMIQADALQRLLTDYKEVTEQGLKVGLIEGVQVGRHGVRMIGAWRMDDLENPTVMSTIPYNTSSFFEKIDGGGLYCFITPMELFLAHTWSWHDECFSVDVMYGIELRKKGYTNLIDWTVVTGHTDQHGNVLYPNDNCTVARYEKHGDEWKLQPYGKGQIS